MSIVLNPSAYEEYEKKVRKVLEKAMIIQELEGDDVITSSVYSVPTWNEQEKEKEVEKKAKTATAVMVKIDDGTRAIVQNESTRGFFEKGEKIQNRQFKQFAKGTTFNAVMTLSPTGRKMVQHCYIPSKFKTPASEPTVMSGSELLSRATGTAVGSPTPPSSITIPTPAPSPMSGAATTPVSASVVVEPEEGTTFTPTVKIIKEREQMPTPSKTRGYHINHEARLTFTTAKHMSDARPERAVKIMMIGPSGYGKTTLPKLFAEVTGMNFLRMNCATIRDPEEWFGYREALDGSTLFVPSQFGQAIQEGNLVVVLDEFNRLEPWLHNTLFPLLDDDGRTVVHDHEFSIGPNVIVVGTINTGYKYTGTFELDEALMNRFDFVLEVGPLDSKHEVQVLMERTGIAMTDANQLVKLANTLRQSDFVCSTRTTLLIASMIRGGMTMREAFESAVVLRVPRDNSGNALRKQVIDLVNTQVGILVTKDVPGDVFSEQSEPEGKEEVNPKKVRHQIVLWHNKEEGLGFINLIANIRKLPLVETNGGQLALNKAQSLAEEIRKGNEVVFDLIKKPANFDHYIADLKKCGVSGRYTSFTA